MQFKCASCVCVQVCICHFFGPRCRSYSAAGIYIRIQIWSDNVDIASIITGTSLVIQVLPSSMEVFLSVMLA